MRFLAEQVGLLAPLAVPKIPAVFDPKPLKSGHADVGSPAPAPGIRRFLHLRWGHLGAAEIFPETKKLLRSQAQ
jgi:hypothetical protein